MGNVPVSVWRSGPPADSLPMGPAVRARVRTSIELVGGLVRTLGKGPHGLLCQSLKYRVHAPARGTWVTVELCCDASQPLSEPFGAGTVQGECSPAERGHFRRECVGQLQ
ncbi:hypothetical protein GCM10022245_23630 [Streptomyces mayteni]